MGNCLVTRLKESVNNDSLPVFGAIRIQVQAINASDYNSEVSLKKMVLNNASAFKVMTTGDGRFGTTASSLTDNENTFNADEDVTLYFSNGNYNIYIFEKYTLKSFNCTGYVNGKKSSLFHFDLCEFSQSSLLSILRIAALWENVTGSIESLALKEMTTLVCQNTYVTGDISTFKVTDTFNCQGTKIYGDFTNILKYVTTPGQPFKDAPNGNRDGVLSADFSQANSNIKRFNTGNIYSNIVSTWKNVRPNEYYVLALCSDAASVGFDFGDDLDAMLINQASCTNDASKTAGVASTIAVFGNRTSASDAAIATLKGYGYTVKVNNETL